jgi:hypothetical protein
MKDARSSILLPHLQEVLDASVSPAAALQGGQQQYQTPPEWAQTFCDLLPSQCPDVVFDPQCAGGHLLKPFSYSTTRLGVEIDSRFGGGIAYSTAILRGNCVRVWELLDDLYPDLVLECQVANPPFALKWKIPKGKAESGNPLLSSSDSTAYTWAKIEQRASPEGYGYFIANADTLERLGLSTHPWVYLYQRFPAGMWPNTTVEIGVIHWHRGHTLRFQQDPPITCRYQTMPTPEQVKAQPLVQEILRHYEHVFPPGVDYKEWVAAFKVIDTILREERAGIPSHNFGLDARGHLQVHLSTQVVTKRKLTEGQINALSGLHGSHPLALVPDVANRRLLHSLVKAGLYTLSPEAQRAIALALQAAERQSIPLMPVTDFEAVAYVDELDELTAAGGPATETRKQKAESGNHPSPFSSQLSALSSSPSAVNSPLSAVSPLPFTPGKAYPFNTGAYRFTQSFKRKKVTVNEDTGRSQLEDHECELSGTDRYVELTDDLGHRHRFLAHPQTAEGADAWRWQGCTLHPEAELWHHFVRPVVPTVAEAYSTRVLEHIDALLGMEPVQQRDLVTTP